MTTHLCSALPSVHQLSRFESRTKKKSTYPSLIQTCDQGESYDCCSRSRAADVLSYALVTEVAGDGSQAFDRTITQLDFLLISLYPKAGPVRGGGPPSPSPPLLQPTTTTIPLHSGKQRDGTSTPCPLRRESGVKSMRREVEWISEQRLRTGSWGE